MSDPTYLYHYTDYNGYLAILNSGYIRKSSSGRGDAYFGDGVYLTAIGPDANTFEILLNNWDDRVRINSTLVAKTQYCFAILKSSIPDVRKMFDRSNRDIWLHPTEIILQGKGIIVYQRNT